MVTFVSRYNEETDGRKHKRIVEDTMTQYFDNLDTARKFVEIRSVVTPHQHSTDEYEHSFKLFELTPTLIEEA